MLSATLTEKAPGSGAMQEEAPGGGRIVYDCNREMVKNDPKLLKVLPIKFKGGGRRLKNVLSSDEDEIENEDSNEIQELHFVHNWPSKQPANQAASLPQTQNEDEIENISASDRPAERGAMRIEQTAPDAGTTASVRTDRFAMTIEGTSE